MPITRTYQHEWSVISVNPTCHNYEHNNYIFVQIYFLRVDTFEKAMTFFDLRISSCVIIQEGRQTNHHCTLIWPFCPKCLLRILWCKKKFLDLFFQSSTSIQLLKLLNSSMLGKNLWHFTSFQKVSTGTSICKKSEANPFHVSDQGIQEKFMSRTSSGGMVVNETILQLSVESLPFGGVGNSGMGAYHGKVHSTVFQI